MLCSLQDVENELQVHMAEYGVPPEALYLTAPEYHSIVTEVCGASAVLPDLEDVTVLTWRGPVNLWLTHNGRAQDSTDKIIFTLHEYGYSSGGCVKLGPYSWAVPAALPPTRLTSVPAPPPGNQLGKSGFAQWAGPQSQSVRNISWTGLDGSGIINPTGEPACCCVSPSEHDPGCAWLAWKRSKK
jgi:hypothetical protein